MPDVWFWIGLAVAVPLSILGNLATPRVSRWWAATNDRRLAQYAQEQRRFEERVAAYAVDPMDLTHYILSRIVTCIGLGVLGGIMAIAAGAATIGLASIDSSLFTAAIGTLWVLLVLVLLTIFTTATGTLGMVRAVRRRTGKLPDDPA